MTESKQNTDQRPFMVVYDDCLESDLFDDACQIVLYITLKKFANSNNQYFPSLEELAYTAKMTKGEVQKKLKELEQKHILSIDNSQEDTIYTLYDFKELWNAKNKDEAARVVAQYENSK